MSIAHTHGNALSDTPSLALPYEVTQFVGDPLSSKGVTKLVIQESEDEILRQSREAIWVAFEILEVIEEAIVEPVYVVECEALPVSCKENVRPIVNPT